MRRLLPSIFLLGLSQAIAGPPFITDDADPTDYKKYEIYFFEASDKNHEELNIAFPALELDYGVMENLEIGVTFLFVSNHPAEEKNAFGFGDLLLEGKYRFNKETKTMPEFAFSPSFTLPTGSRARGLGNGTTVIQLPLNAEKNFEPWQIYGSGGYTINPGNENQNFWFGGAVAQYEFNDHWMTGVELYSQSRSEKDLGSFLLLNLGGALNLSKQVSILFSLGHTLVGENHTVTYVGLYFTDQEE